MKKKQQVKVKTSIKAGGTKMDCMLGGGKWTGNGCVEKK